MAASHDPARKRENQRRADGGAFVWWRRRSNANGAGAVICNRVSKALTYQGPVTYLQVSVATSLSDATVREAAAVAAALTAWRSCSTSANYGATATAVTRRKRRVIVSRYSKHSKESGRELSIS